DLVEAVGVLGLGGRVAGRRRDEGGGGVAGREQVAGFQLLQAEAGPHGCPDRPPGTGAGVGALKGASHEKFLREACPVDEIAGVTGGQIEDDPCVCNSVAESGRSTTLFWAKSLPPAPSTRAASSGRGVVTFRLKKPGFSEDTEFLGPQ